MRSQVRATLRFLTWLDAQQATLATLTQPVLERWLARDGGPGADEIRDFLTWAQERGLAKELTVPIPTPREALVALEEDERWAHLRSALTDEDPPLDLRTAAALMLLYGLTFSRIQQLRRDEVEERLDGIHLCLYRRGGTGYAWPNPSATFSPSISPARQVSGAIGRFLARCRDSRSPRACASGCAGPDSRTSPAPAPPR